MCNSEGIDVTIMSLWHVPTSSIYYVAGEYCGIVCGKLRYFIFLSSLESPLLLENKEAIQTAE